jgi:Na+-driven multidrug efflux pump
VFGAVRQTLQAMHRTGAIVAAIVVGNAANLVLNLAFVHGRWGAPRSARWGARGRRPRRGG